VGPTGFDVVSEAGDLNVTFNWTAVGRESGKERRPDVVIPDRDANLEQAREEQRRLEAERANRPTPPPVLADEK
jgi:hypothetical protein